MITRIDSARPGGEDLFTHAMQAAIMHASEPQGRPSCTSGTDKQAEGTKAHTVHSDIVDYEDNLGTRQGQ